MGNNEVVNNDQGIRIDFAYMDELDRKTGHILQYENGQVATYGNIGHGCRCTACWNKDKDKTVYRHRHNSYRCKRRRNKLYGRGGRFTIRI
jgi:hypothetical protein